MFTVGASLAVFFMTAVQGVLLAHILGPKARGEYSAVTFYTQVLTYIGLLARCWRLRGGPRKAWRTIRN